MPNTANSFAVGDARQAHGYGTNRGLGAGDDAMSSKSWPYVTLTDLEIDASEGDVDEETLDAIDDVIHTHLSNDRLGAGTYKSHAFVNGSTRGLTGIMAGYERELSIMQDLVNEMGLKANVGQASPSYDITGPWDARIRPTRRVGTKRGTSMSPAPKTGDPVNSLRTYTLKSIADMDDDKFAVIAAEIDKINKQKTDDVDGHTKSVSECLAELIKMI